MPYRKVFLEGHVFLPIVHLEEGFSVLIHNTIQDNGECLFVGVDTKLIQYYMYS